jgi:hypothetical protein
VVGEIVNGTGLSLMWVSSSNEFSYCNGLIYPGLPKLSMHFDFGTRTKAGAVAQVAESLSSKHRTPSSKSNTALKKVPS